jgi:ribonucleoside-diphosphate reductase alpha chain
MTRSIGEPVQKGRFLHRGKLPYYGASGKHARANIQGGRGGALNLFFESFDPEARVIAGLRDTRAAGEKSNREAHYAFLQNGYFLALAAQNKKAFCWNINTAPDLHKAFYGDDLQEFITIYKKYEADDKFVKTWFDARDLLLYAMTQWASTGTIYRANIDEMNRNTPFIDPIHSSNLCMEISEHTRAYEGPDAMRDLYSTTLVGFIHFVGRTAEGEVSQYKLHASQVVKPLNHRKTRISAQDLQVGMTFTHYTDTVTVEEIIKVKYEPEVALCNLAAINLTEELSEEVYADATYYSLRLVDYCILESEYILPHIGVTAKKRMNAAVGLMGVATHMARRRLKYNSEEGLKEGFRIAERHYWHLVNASLQLSKERGIPDWMERSKRPDGWLPHENAKPYAFTLANFEYAYDWAAKKLEIIANGGLGHTVICAYMPGESSSKALAATNSIYPIRELVLLKTDGESQMRWAAPYGDDSTYFYQSVYDLSLTDMNSWYAVFQIWNDQAISADAFVDFNRRMTTTDTEGKTKDEIKQAAMKLLTSTELLEAELDRTKKGVKTVYYFNTKMPVDDTNSKLPTESIFGTSTEKETPEQLAARLMAEMGGSDERADCAGCSV